MLNQCTICSSGDTTLILHNFPGYIEGSFFDIYKCNHCDSHFVNIKDNINELYNIIYSSENVAGYDRYHSYLHTIKNKKNPLRFLAYSEASYFPVHEYVKDKKGLKILEIGCGYGYLTYSLKKMGFDIIGLDVSSIAINFARENFGNYFYSLNLNEFVNKATHKFDLIIFTEVIEHIRNPNDFVDDCIKLLNEKGKIILTSPNRNFSSSNSIWQTDLPPIHLSWISKKGIKYLAENHNLKAFFYDFSNYSPRNLNILVKYLRNKYLKPKQERLSQEGKPTSKSTIFKIIEYSVHKVPFIRLPSNLIYNKFIGIEITLGVVLEKV